VSLLKADVGQVKFIALIGHVWQVRPDAAAVVVGGFVDVVVDVVVVGGFVDVVVDIVVVTLPSIADRLQTNDRIISLHGASFHFR